MHTSKKGKLLNEKVFLFLKDAIVKGDLKPGEKLAEEEIAKKLNISRTPVREALRKLDSLGFVKLYPNQGIFVSQITIEDLKEIIQIRAILEGFATRLVANLINDQEIKKLEKIVKKMSNCFSEINKNNTVNKYCNYDLEFHNLILEIANNGRLKNILNNLRDVTISFRTLSFKTPGNIEYSLGYHIKIVEALKNKNARKAELLAQEHVLTSIDRVLVST